MEILTCENCGATLRHEKQRQFCYRCCSIQIPNPEEIAAMCEAIRATWSDAQLAQREVSPMTELRVPIVRSCGVQRRGGVKDVN